MIKHYFKIAFRNLKKYKQQNIISVLGLAVGFVFFSLSAVWIQYEGSFDDFHPNADRMYAVNFEDKNQQSGISSITPYPLANYLKANFPEIEDACTVANSPTLIEANGKPEGFLALEADSSFLRMFKLPTEDLDFLNIREEDPYSTKVVPVAITDITAKEIFSGNPLGTEMKALWGNDVVIRKQVKSLPRNSRFYFQFLSPLTVQDEWNVSRYETYILLAPNVDVKKLEEKLSNLDLSEYTYSAKNLVITPLNILRIKYPPYGTTVKYEHVKIFAYIGLLIVFCALFNYLMLFANRMKMRSREFGLRKINGASKNSLLLLLYVEFSFILLCALIISSAIAYIILPDFKELSRIAMDNGEIYGKALLFFLILSASIILLSIMPTIYFLNKTLNKSVQEEKSKSLGSIFYKVCIFIQLSISLGVLFSTAIMIKQINHLAHLDIGFDKHRISQVEFMMDFSTPIFPYVNQIEQLTDIESVTRSKSEFLLFSRGSTSTRINDWPGKGTDDPVDFELMDMSLQTIDFLGLKFLSGRNFDPNVVDNSECIINESAAKIFGWEDPIGKEFRLYNGENRGKVIGIVKDFIYVHPNLPVKPILIRNTKEENAFAYKYKPGTKEKVEKAITEMIRKDHPDAELSFSYMDDKYNDFFKSEAALIKMLKVATLVCIIISAFGVYSMISLTCNRKRKEIAIRKVNGATVQTILSGLLKEYILLLISAAIVAFPIGYMIMSSWLEDYKLRTEIDWWVYILIFTGTLFVTTLTVFSQVWRAANQNPAKVLKSE